MKKAVITSNKSDFILMFVTISLVIIGLLMVFSSSVVMADVRWKSPYMFVTKQAIWVVFGMIGMYFASITDYKEFQKIIKPALIITAVLLVMVVFIGPAKGGAKGWLRWGFFSFQPSELAKIVVVAAIADYLDRKKSRLKAMKGLWSVLFILGLFCGLIALEPDLGTPILISTVTICLLLAAGAKISNLAVIGAAILPVVVEEILRKPYRLARVKSYLASWGTINSNSYQLAQSILALGSGGFFGKGLAQGEMKLMYLPEPHTDFIFPIIGEELGFIGAIFVIMLFIIFAYRGLLIAKNSKDFFGTIFATGLTLIIVFQAIINIGVSCGMLPTKGLPLPFVSFGGSALFFNLCEVGILLNISKNNK